MGSICNKLYLIDSLHSQCYKPNEMATEKEISLSANKSGCRRLAVAAEQYDPENDSDDQKVVYPKTSDQRERLAAAVKHIFVFRSLDAEQTADVINAMFEVKVKADETIIKQGDDGDNFYVIDSGIFEVFLSNDGKLSLTQRLEHKGSFGEISLMYNVPRTATVKSASDGTLWAMNRSSFRSIVLKSAYKKRQLYDKFLSSVPVLKCLSDYDRMNVADVLVSKTFADTETIIKEGDAPDGMFFVESGKVRVTVRNKQRVEVTVKQLHAGQYFGEYALLENTPRTASIYADGPVTVAFLERSAFERLLGPCINRMRRKSEAYVVSNLKSV